MSHIIQTETVLQRIGEEIASYLNDPLRQLSEFQLQRWRREVGKSQGINPGQAEFLLAAIDFLDGNSRGMENHLQISEMQQTAMARFCYNAAVLCAEIGEKEKAVRYGQRAVVLEPVNMGFLKSLILHHVLSGQMQAAANLVRTEWKKRAMTEQADHWEFIISAADLLQQHDIYDAQTEPVVRLAHEILHQHQLHQFGMGWLETIVEQEGEEGVIIYIPLPEPPERIIELEDAYLNALVQREESAQVSQFFTCVYTAQGARQRVLRS